MKKKIIAAALICSIMFSVFAVPSSAVLTETVVAGGLIAAYMAAVGITVAVDNRSDSELGQWIYDRFQNWVDNTSTAITVGDLIAGIAIQNGQIKIQNGISKILSRFMPELVAVDVITNRVKLNGVPFEIPVINKNSTTIKYVPNCDSTKKFQMKFTDNLFYNGIFFKYVSYTADRHSYYYPKQLYNNVEYQLSYEKFDLNINGSDRNTVDEFMLCILVDGTRRYLGALSNRQVPADQSNKKLYFAGIPDTIVDLTPSTQITTGQITMPLPSESLSDDEETVINIGVPVTSVSDAAEKALASTIEGTISATYTNSNPIPPVPETNLSWVRSLHSIWEYVEYLIDQASAGFTFFSGLLAALPVEVEFCFYGALVLLLFGGVISRLLL